MGPPCYPYGSNYRTGTQSLWENQKRKKWVSQDHCEHSPTFQMGTTNPLNCWQTIQNVFAAGCCPEIPLSPQVWTFIPPTFLCRSESVTWSKSSHLQTSLLGAKSNTVTQRCHKYMFKKPKPEELVKLSHALRLHSSPLWKTHKPGYKGCELAF